MTMKHYRYAMVNRPVGIGTCPKDFVAVEERPAAGKPHHDMARNGVVVYDRRLTDHEQKQFELAYMLDDANDLAEFADMVIERFGEYAEQYLEMRSENAQHFEREVRQKLKTATKDSHMPSVPSEGQFAAIVASRLAKKLSSALSATVLRTAAVGKPAMKIKPTGNHISLRRPTDEKSVVSFISAALVILCKLNGRDASPLKEDFVHWSSGSGPFLASFGLARTCVKIFNVYLQKGAITESMADELGDALKDKIEDIKRDISISGEHLKLIKDIILQLRTASVPAWNRIHRDVAVLGDPKLTASFPLENDDGTDATVLHQSIAKISKSLAALVLRVTGKAGKFLTRLEAANLRTSNPGDAAEYGGYIKAVNKASKQAIFNYVRSQRKAYAKVDDVRAMLADRGIPSNLPVGFLGGQIDDQGKFYTAEGRQLNSAPTGQVRMNPRYVPDADNTYVLEDVAEGIKYRTLTFVRGNKEARSSKVNDFIAAETEHRAAWVKDLLSGTGRDPIIATIVELIWATSSRIGGLGNATAGEPTYGMSTLQVRHLEITSTYISYDYTGKKLARQGAKYLIKDPVSRKVAKILRELVEGKKANDLVFTYKTKTEVKVKPIIRAAVNLYLRRKGIELSIHNFRNVAGTKLAAKILKTSPFKRKDNPSQAEVTKWVKEALKDVGVLLHHRNGENVTSSTALKSYIDSELIRNFFTELNLRDPKLN